MIPKQSRKKPVFDPGERPICKVPGCTREVHNHGNPNSRTGHHGFRDVCPYHHKHGWEGKESDGELVFEKQKQQHIDPVEMPYQGNPLQTMIEG